MSKTISVIGRHLLKFVHIGYFIIGPSQPHNAVLEKMIVKVYCANQCKKLIAFNETTEKCNTVRGDTTVRSAEL